MTKKAAEQQSCGFGGFSSFASTWQRGKKPAVFRTEFSARYYLRKNYHELVQAKAVIFHAGEIFVHRERLEAVMEEIGLRLASERGEASKAAA